MKDGFIMQAKYEKHFRRIGEKRGYMLLMAIFEYEQTRIIPELDESIEDAFYFIKDDLDRAYENYQNAVDRNKANGSKGGRPKKPNGKTENPENPVGFQKPKKPDNELDSDNDFKEKEKDARAYPQFYSENIGVITPFIVQEVESYLDDGFSEDVVIMALQESIGTSSPWKYAKAILDSWLEKKAFTAEQAKAALIEFKRRRSKPTADKKSFEQREYAKEDLEKRKADNFAELERMYGNGSG